MAKAKKKTAAKKAAAEKTTPQIDKCFVALKQDDTVVFVNVKTPRLIQLTKHENGDVTLYFGQDARSITAKKDEITGLENVWMGGAQYKRQIEVYQWLLRRNGLKVSDTGYFVYCNGVAKDGMAFDKRLEFDVNLIDYKGSDKWVPKTLKEIKKVLDSKKIPKSSSECDHCKYVAVVNKYI